jgi:hypothetical protein
LEKGEERDSLETLGVRWEDIIKMDRKGIGLKSVD